MRRCVVWNNGCSLFVADFRRSFDCVWLVFVDPLLCYFSVCCCCCSLLTCSSSAKHCFDHCSCNLFVHLSESLRFCEFLNTLPHPPTHKNKIPRMTPPPKKSSPSTFALQINQIPQKSTHVPTLTTCSRSSLLVSNKQRNYATEYSLPCR